jgi:DNA-directed RNA polymerase specialized sigma24 family protein
VIDKDEYTELAGQLSAAELRDYIGVEILGYGVREWAAKVGIAHQNISPRLRKARAKIREANEE